jgi:nicotinic acetylcholine receptor, invertebrate
MGSVLLAAVFIALQFVIGKANPDSKRLYDDLLSNYNRLIRPVGECNIFFKEICSRG